MWKCGSRRFRDTVERSANQLDKCNNVGLAYCPFTSGYGWDFKSKHSAQRYRWFSSRKCWNSFHYDNTKEKRWHFANNNGTWIGAITWSSALVAGWYTSQILHFKLKYCSATTPTNCSPIFNILEALRPYVNYVNKNSVYSNSGTNIEKVISLFTPTVHLVANEQKVKKDDRDPEIEGSTKENSKGDLGYVLNSIENRLGLAAIESGQHQAGLNLLKSAANRNHAPALYNLGLCYEMGVGVVVDEKVAMELYRSAAALEHAGALYNLGVYYGQGRGGLRRDISTATRLLRLAAVQGQEDAIKALKELDVCVTEPSSGSWTYYPSSPDNIIPTHSTLFVENVNLLHSGNHEAAVY